MNSRQTLLIATISGFIAVALGAFGAHALKPLLVANNRLDTFELASRYQFYHTLVLLAIGIWQSQNKSRLLGNAAIFILAGILIFSGSLYFLSLTGNTKLGMITPIGGVGLLIGWVCLLLVALKTRSESVR